MLAWSADRFAEHGLSASAHRNPIPDAPQNLTELYDTALDDEPNKLAVIGRSGALSFAELEAEVNAACAYLSELRVQAGDRVAVSLANDIHIVVAFLAVQRMGGIWVGINRAYVGAERRHFLSDAGANVFVTDPAIAEETTAIADTLPDLRHVIALDPLDGQRSDWHRGLRRHAGAARPSTVVDPFSPAAIAYTSGTTGLPKGAVHSQHNILVAATVAELVAVDNRPDVIRGATSPLTILNVMILGPVATLSRGRRVVCMDRIDAQGIAEWVRRERVNTLTLVPTSLYDLLMRPDIAVSDLASLTWVVVSAAAVPEGLDTLYRERLGRDFTISYGLTENPTTVSRSHTGSSGTPGAVGRPLFHLDVAIFDDTGARAGSGARGEICVRAADHGPWANVYTPALGYWKKAAATAKLLEDGWLHTGDIGFLDDEGELHIQDRQSDVINRGGAKVYPAEVERVLMMEPDVHDCAVAARPDRRLGHTVAAYIQPSSGVDGPELIERLRHRCTRDIAKYKVPAHWIIVDVIPRNTMGKVLKRQLLETDSSS